MRNVVILNGDSKQERFFFQAGLEYSIMWMNNTDFNTLVYSIRFVSILQDKHRWILEKNTNYDDERSGL